VLGNKPFPPSENALLIAYGTCPSLESFSPETESFLKKKVW